MKGFARRGSGWGAYRPSKLRLVQRCMHATAHNEQHLHSRTGDTRVLRRRFPSHLSGLESPPAYLWLAGVFSRLLSCVCQWRPPPPPLFSSSSASAARLAVTRETKAKTGKYLALGMLRRIATEPSAFGFAEERTIGGYIAARGQGPTRKRAHDTLAYISMCVRLRVFYLARVLYSRTEQHMPPVPVYSLHRGRGRARASENSGVARQRTNPALNPCVVVFVFFLCLFRRACVW